jgi:glycosyltransferase involved in cell wall biosynthesis
MVGFCGSLSRSRGLDILFSAFEMIREELPASRLILSGRKERGVTLPDHAHWLGYVRDDLVPILFNCLDVLQVVNRLSSFGKYSYPVKLYEAMACHLPVVATDTPPARWILSGSEEYLARPEDPLDLAVKTCRLLTQKSSPPARIGTWEESARIFEDALRDAG